MIVTTTYQGTNVYEQRVQFVPGVGHGKLYQVPGRNDCRGEINPTPSVTRNAKPETLEVTPECPRSRDQGQGKLYPRLRRLTLTVHQRKTQGSKPGDGSEMPP